MDRSHEFARALLTKARDDFHILQTLAHAPNSPRWGLGFHAQQAAEKALKAVLANRSIRYPRTHDLGALLGALERADVSPPPDADRLPWLTPFSVTLRYPGDDVEPSSDEGFDTAQLVLLVDRTLAWAEAAL
jgi:HEPN domain-containing protein